MCRNEVGSNTSRGLNPDLPRVRFWPARTSQNITRVIFGGDLPSIIHTYSLQISLLTAEKILHV